MNLTISRPAQFSTAPSPGPRLAPIERLPKWLLCVPLVLHWFALAARHRSLTLPSCANPAIPSGGLAGESKLACLALIRPDHAAWVAPTAMVRPGTDAEAERRRAGLAFPLVAKPDVGWCGYGVRRVDDAAALDAYARAFPREAAFLLQPFITGPMEAGLMYRRQPGAPRGELVAVTLRHAPAVLGDGRRSIAALAAADPRLRGRTLPSAARVPVRGERVGLSTVASLRVGARYEAAPFLITPALAARVDAIARGMGEFHAGRFDVRFASMADLRAGRFTIIEVNGVGAESIDAWDPQLGLLAAFARVFANHRAVFALGAAMRARGRRPVGWRGLSAAWLRQQRLTRRYPVSN